MSERKGKIIPCRWTENRKGAVTNSGEPDVSNLEAERIRSRVESMGLGGYVKLKIVTEIRQSSVGATFIAASVYDLSCTKFFAGLGASAWQWRD